jgi:hypothetical protein
LADLLEDLVLAGDKRSGLQDVERGFQGLGDGSALSACTCPRPSGAAQLLQNFESSLFSAWQRGHFIGISPPPLTGIEYEFMGGESNQAANLLRWIKERNLVFS